MTDRRFRLSRAVDGSLSLRARVALAAGEILVPFRIAELLPDPVRHSIQVGTDAHALVEPAYLRFLNHSCDPNTVVDTSALCLLAIRDIEPGDELTYFYPSTEWSMAEPFACRCESARCLRTIAGAAYLPRDVLAGYRLAEHIERLLAGHRNEQTAKPARGLAPERDTRAGIRRSRRAE